MAVAQGVYPPSAVAPPSVVLQRLQYLPVHLIRLSADTAIGCNGTVGGAEGGHSEVREEIISQLRLLPAPHGTSPATRQLHPRSSFLIQPKAVGL